VVRRKFLSIRSSLVNEEYQDPVVFVGFDGQRDALLLDCGYIFPLKLRDIQRLTSIFVSHTHFDHFMGFDQFLRVSMEQSRQVEIYGPAGFIAQVAHKLGGYSWNLCENIELDFAAREIVEGSMKEAILTGRQAYELGEIRELPISEGIIKDHELYQVKVAILDHRIPSLAYSVQEKDMVRVRKEELKKLGVEPGPWIRDLKEGAPTPSGSDLELEVEGKTFKRAFLETHLLEEKKGRKISYIVDTIFNKKTAKAALGLIKGSDELYCEMAYLSGEKDKALQNYHLTARQAATLARDGGVKKLFPVHFSKRYDKRYQELIEEAREIFPAVERAPRYSGY
jgi:ribonuclease Z